MNANRLILAALFAATPSLACAPVAGEGRYVRIETEEALIIWDGAAKTEHFIRRAAFDTDAKDFGFLVPTPTPPDLAEASDETFGYLERLTRPPAPKVAAAAKAEAPKGPPVAPVVVLERKRVAGFDAAILAASDAGALDAWLKHNGYRSSPALVQWYQPYVAKGWKITAFKIAGSAPRVDTAGVRMSFQTGQPFFPYREPAAKPGGNPRLLRVYLLAEDRVAGTIGADGEWPARTLWSSTVEERDRDRLLQLVALPYTSAPNAVRLTLLEDASSPRPGTDEVYFKPAADQSQVGVAREPYAGTGNAPRLSTTRSSPDDAEGSIRIWIWIALAVVLAAAIVYFCRFRKSHG